MSGMLCIKYLTPSTIIGSVRFAPIYCRQRRPTAVIRGVAPELTMYWNWDPLGPHLSRSNHFEANSKLVPAFKPAMIPLFNPITCQPTTEVSLLTLSLGV